MTRAVLLSAVRTPDRPLRRRAAQASSRRSGRGRGRGGGRARRRRPGRDRGRLPRLRQPGRARTTATSRAWRRCWQACRSRSPGVTLNRLCASGLAAISAACHAVVAGDGDLFVAGGVESMSRAPLVTGKPERAFPRGDRTLYDSTLGWRFPNPAHGGACSRSSRMGETGENVAERYDVSREDQDAFALRSQQRWAEAQAAGRFADELIPVGDVDASTSTRGPTRRRRRWRRCSPAFRAGGTVTAGNSSGINDGAAAARHRQRGAARAALGAEPLGAFAGSGRRGRRSARDGHRARFRRCASCSRARASRVEELDLVELNEAFASQSLAVVRELGLDEERVNVNGGAIALGHPLGHERCPPRRLAGCTSCAAATAATGSPRCASASARARPRCSSARRRVAAHAGRRSSAQARPG